MLALPCRIVSLFCIHKQFCCILEIQNPRPWNLTLGKFFSLHNFEYLQETFYIKRIDRKEGKTAIITISSDTPPTWQFDIYHDKLANNILHLKSWKSFEENCALEWNKWSANFHTKNLLMNEMAIHPNVLHALIRNYARMLCGLLLDYHTASAYTPELF